MERQGERKEGWREGGGGEIWRDNITCVKCRRVCAHRNMFNGFYDCREGCVRCLYVTERCMHPQTTKGVYSVTWIHAGDLCVSIYTTCVYHCALMCTSMWFMRPFCWEFYF